MLELMIIVFLIVWLIGGIAFPVGTSAIHLLLVIVIVLVILKISRGEKL